MKLLEEKILKEGKVKPGNVLKVDGFLNHRMDIKLLDKMGREFKRLYKKSRVTKILTIEASGIGIACMTARHFKVPVVFAKKSATSNISDDVYSTQVFSYTHGNMNNVVLSKEYLTSDDKVLIIDDFLAVGAALSGLIDLCNQAGAEVVGCGIAIEKAFQDGGRKIRERGYRVESLAMIEGMDPEKGIVFTRQFR